MTMSSEDYLQLVQRLRQLFRARLSNELQLEDLIQDVFVKMLHAQRQGTEIRNLGAWLYTATKHAVVDYYRRDSQLQVSPLEELDKFLDEPSDHIAVHAELSQCLKPFIERLDEPYRRTLLALEYSGASQMELARREGVSISAIKSRAARAREKLRCMLERCCSLEFHDGLVSNYARRSGRCCS